MIVRNLLLHTKESFYGNEKTNVIRLVRPLRKNTTLDSFIAIYIEINKIH